MVGRQIDRHQINVQSGNESTAAYHCTQIFAFCCYSRYNQIDKLENLHSFKYKSILCIDRICFSVILTRHIDINVQDNIYIYIYIYSKPPPCRKSRGHTGDQRKHLYLCMAYAFQLIQPSSVPKFKGGCHPPLLNVFLPFPLVETLSIAVHGVLVHYKFQDALFPR